MILLSDAAKALDAKLLGNDLAFGAVTINGREDCTDALFVALKGENFDAHDYVQQASDAGASAALVSRPVEVDIPQLLVTDTQSAFTALAAWWRAKFSLPIVAITGSVGKTTVKQMLVSIASVEHETLGTHGNLNNEIGVPLTLMRLNSDHRFAVIELGMNHAGEISRLTRLVKPNVALLNNAAAAHLEGLGSLEAIAAAKGEIFEGLDADGTAVVNLDDSFAAYWMDLVGEHRVITFGLASHADVTADWQQHGNSISIRLKLSNRFVDFDMPGRGEHLVQNALAAAAAAHASGIGIDAIKTGLERFSAPSGRQQFHQVGDLTVIDDTYFKSIRTQASTLHC
ncbi:MAG: UDP-N-acetylmuramoyl-tripeptide--D-alanyl-D-alanine ligase [Pseudomonadota bacterium]